MAMLKGQAHRINESQLGQIKKSLEDAGERIKAQMERARRPAATAH
jgi:hypothetical protein